MKKKPRRILAGFLIVLGAILLLIATETWGGLILILIGIAIEIIGIALEKR